MYWIEQFSYAGSNCSAEVSGGYEVTVMYASMSVGCVWREKGRSGSVFVLRVGRGTEIYEGGFGGSVRCGEAAGGGGRTGVMWSACARVWVSFDRPLYTSPSPPDRTRSRMPPSA